MWKFAGIVVLSAGVAFLTTRAVQDGAATDRSNDPGLEDLATAEARTEHVRQLMTEARSLFRREIKSLVKNVDLRLARIEALRKAMDEGVAATQVAAEDAAQGSYNKLEAMEQELDGLTALADAVKDLTTRIAKLEERLAEIEPRLVAVESRPVYSGPPPTNGGGGTKPKPPKPEPDRPTLPAEPTKDPETVRQETEKALRDMASNDLDVLFPAIEKVREHRVMEAVPRLLEILGEFKDEFGRTAAAAALGRMEVCDAVPALAEALVDRSGLVAQQANKAIIQITKFETHLSASARIRERRTARNRVKAWWREHEDEVRARLGQPKK